jgi:hypothetical protein
MRKRGTGRLRQSAARTAHMPRRQPTRGSGSRLAERGISRFSSQSDPDRRVGVRSQHGVERYCHKAKAGQHHHKVKIFLLRRTSLLSTRRGCLLACWQEINQSLADDQVVRLLLPKDRQPSDHRLERLSREGFRQRRKPGGLLPRVYIKSGQRRNDVERHAVLLISDGSKEKVVQIRMKQRKSSRKHRNPPSPPVRAPTGSWQAVPRKR